MWPTKLLITQHDLQSLFRNTTGKTLLLGETTITLDKPTQLEEQKTYVVPVQEISSAEKNKKIASLIEELKKLKLQTQEEKAEQVRIAKASPIKSLTLFTLSLASRSLGSRSSTIVTKKSCRRTKKRLQKHQQEKVSRQSNNLFLP